MESSRAKIVRAPDAYTQEPGIKSIFLAGTIEKDDAWRELIIKQLLHLPIAIFNPYQPKWDSTWVQDISDPRFVKQVNWELDMMDEADVIAVYFSKETAAPITMLEVGLGARHGKVVVACPDSEHSRRGNFQILERRIAGFVLVHTLDQLVESVKMKLDL
jgi:hypothetical protein